jgi:hypothetical protein
MAKFRASYLCKKYESPCQSEFYDVTRTLGHALVLKLFPSHHGYQCDGSYLNFGITNRDSKSQGNHHILKNLKVVKKKFVSIISKRTLPVFLSSWKWVEIGHHTCISISAAFMRLYAISYIGCEWYV